MSSNLRRKILQKDIKTYSEFQTEILWNSDIIAYLYENPNFGNQRYSKNKVNKTFDKHKIRILVPYYKEIGIEAYNMIPCASSSFWERPNIKRDDNPLGKKKIEKSFLLGETEITQDLYHAVMDGLDFSKFPSTPTHPVENVSWYDALIFCNKLSDIFELEHYYTIGKAREKDVRGKKEKHYSVKTNENSKGFRLPTEWEWEYATKAGTQLEYSGSDNVDEVGWYKDNSKSTTNRVKGKKPNAWGFYDMSGNVWEWCENTWDSEDRDISALRVYRGGSWTDVAPSLRSTSRRGNSPAFRLSNLGFRVCRYI